jgi:membrane protease YdiL (CAAX protease family)
MTIAHDHRRHLSLGEPPIDRAPVKWSTVSLFIAGTWLVSPVFLVLQGVLNLDGEVLSLVTFAPASAALLVAAVRRRSDPAAAGLLARCIRVDRQTGARAGAGIALVAGIIAIGWALNSLAGQHLQGVHVHGLSRPLMLILVAQFIGAPGEELGWRSFLLPYLQSRYSPSVAAVIVGVAWASWHIQYYSSGLIFMIAFAVACVAISSIMATIQAGTRRGSLYIATSVHWALNIGILLVLPIGGAHVMTMLCLAVAASAVAVLGRLRGSPVVRSTP